MSSIFRISLFSGVTCLWLLFSGAGCGSLGGAASGTFASVTIENHSPEEIAGAAAKVFGAEGYMAGPSRAGQLVFQKDASRATTLSQEGLFATQSGARTMNRVRVEIVPLSGGSSYRLQCQAYTVRDAGALLEDEVRLTSLRSAPYQSLLNKVKKELK
jgi:hypothetical protein